MELYSDLYNFRRQVELGESLFRVEVDHQNIISDAVVDQSTQISKIINDPENFRGSFESYLAKNNYHAGDGGASPFELIYTLMGFFHAHHLITGGEAGKIFYEENDDQVHKFFYTNQDRSTFKSFIFDMNQKNDDLDQLEYPNNEIRVKNDHALVIKIRKPDPGEKYQVETERGIKEFKADSRSPFQVELKSLKLKSYSPNENQQHLIEIENFQTEPDLIKSFLISLHQPVTGKYEVHCSKFFKSMMDNFLTMSKKLGNPYSISKMLSYTQGVLNFNFRNSYAFDVTPILSPENFKSLDKILIISNRDNQNWFTKSMPVVFGQEDPKPSTPFTHFREEILALPPTVNTDAPNALFVRKMPILDGKLAKVKLVKIAQSKPMIDFLLRNLDAGLLTSEARRVIGLHLGEKLDQMITLTKNIKEFFVGQLMGVSKDSAQNFIYRHPFVDTDQNFQCFVIKRGSKGLVIKFLNSENPVLDGELASLDFGQVGLQDVINLEIDTTRKSTSSFREDGIIKIKVHKFTVSPRKLPYFTLIPQVFDPTQAYEILIDQIQRPDMLKRAINSMKKFSSHDIDADSLIKGLFFDHVKMAIPFNDQTNILALEKRVDHLSIGKTQPEPTILLQTTQGEDHLNLDEFRIKVIREVFFNSPWMKTNVAFLKTNFKNDGTNDYQVEDLHELPGERSRAVYKSCVQSMGLMSKGRKKRATVCPFDEEKLSEEKLIKYTQYEENYDAQKTGVVEHHLSFTYRLTQKLMLFQMGKGAVGALIDGDFRRLLKTSGTVAGLLALNYAASRGAVYGMNLLGGANKVGGAALLLGSKALAKLFYVFTIFDLQEKIDGLKNGDKNALVGVAGDAAILGLGVFGTGVELAEEFGLVAAGSLELGPVFFVELAIFAGMDLYYSHQSLETIEKSLDLSFAEKSLEWMRAFVGAQPPAYMRRLIFEKQANDLVAGHIVDTLKNNTWIKMYASPTLAKCENRSGRCETSLAPVANNYLDLSEKHDFYSRTWPKMNSSEKFSVMCTGTEKQGVEHPQFLQYLKSMFTAEYYESAGTKKRAYFCKSAIMIQNDQVPENGVAFLNLGSGDDQVRGLPDTANIFVISGGHKAIVGGRKSDMFELRGDQIFTGLLDGAGGVNVLNLEAYSIQKLIHVDQIKQTFDQNLMIKNFMQIIGRRNQPEVIVCSCQTHLLELHGGDDVVNIPENNTCEYDLKITVDGTTRINNYANEGRFFYDVRKDFQTAVISHASRNSVKSIIQLDYTVDELQSLHVSALDKDFSSVKFQFKNSSILKMEGVLLKTIVTTDDDFFSTFKENKPIMTKYVNESAEIYIKKYTTLSERLNVSIVVISNLTTTKLIIKDDDRCNQESGCEFNVLENDPNYRTHMISLSPQNLYRIKGQCPKFLCSAFQVHIYHVKANMNNTIDLSDLNSLLSIGGKTLQTDVEVSRDRHTIVKLSSRSTEKSQSRLFAKIIIEKSVIDRAYENYVIKMGIYSMKILTDQNGAPFLSQIKNTLKFDEKDHFIILSSDMMHNHLSISIPRTRVTLAPYYSNSSLILTDSSIDDDPKSPKNPLSIIFIDYQKYAKKFDKLKIIFDDVTLALSSLVDNVAIRDLVTVIKSHVSSLARIE